ncbi:uncharacterized protein PgNI_09329 [Pyricularia grisea]|uniref:U3 small nucleolar RNA-associated protein 20 n=1 Tax=Pyricularia grisea TaxID=148305 RepID=A0A6P8ASM4_PYRGI|nr:uncharacterized protein PgNI_09329 [Pyricularia grisea]TLD05102.1 hypothetical protein PgNI_09329 [Pyricularia grisea]
MPVSKSGRIVKARRGTKETAHQKQHRWESFTTKISKLHSLDPLRKVRRHDLESEDLSATTSYLRNGLEKWTDLNLSKPFISFKRELLPLCDSLPQILHFEEKIMGLLVQYISLHEKEALEPLLDLLTAFAHDLGVRFEKHYPKALELIIGLATRPQDAEVVEWTFAALAFLFKYLARLLVPDLRPTYRAMAPLLGRTRQPQYIARFAAEALSFLVKKAAAPSHRDTSLKSLIECARDDLISQAGEKHFELYFHGIMTMFAEALKSSGHTLFSNAPDIYTRLVECVPDEEFRPPSEDAFFAEHNTIWSDVCCGVLISAIHYSTPETFTPLENAIIASTQEAVATQDVQDHPWSLSLHIRLFGTMAGVRRGTRLTNWTGLIQGLSSAMQALSKTPNKLPQGALALIWEHIVVNIAIVWNQSPMDALISSLQTMTAIMTREPFMRSFIPFCSYFSSLNPERFRSIFQDYFQKFINKHWSIDNNEEMLCVLIPKMVDSGALQPGGGSESLHLPESWQGQIVTKFERLEITPFPERGAYDKDPKTWRDKCLPKYSALLRVLESTSVHASTSARIAELLLRKLKLALRPSTSVPTDEAHFIVTSGFRAYLRMARDVDPSLKPLLRAAAPRFCRLTKFLESILAYEEALAAKGLEDGSSSGSESPQTEEDPYTKSLIQNLSTNSHDLRLVSLKLLHQLPSAPKDSSSPLAIMLQVEETPLDLANMRTISVYLRKLGKIYGSIDQSSWLRKAVPTFMFGMMTVRLTSVWDDAVEALKDITESKDGEEMVASLAFEWLEVPSQRWSGPPKPIIQSNYRRSTDFECTNLASLHETSEMTKKVVDEIFDVMLNEFQQAQTVVPNMSQTARSKALKVFTAIPSVAERRSRKLVPHLFSWNNTGKTETDDSEEEQRGNADEAWNLADRKALIGVFALFHNSKVLYQHEQVYKVMLDLMSNGDLDVQKLALKAILAWKQDGVKRYQENLEALLEESRMRNELTMLFQGDKKIRDEDRPELMPVLLRLLYGRAISKKGAASGRAGVQGTRNAIIRSLDVEDIGRFLEIALGPIHDVQVLDGTGVDQKIISSSLVPARKQVGLLRMLDTIITELGSNATLYMGPLVNAVLYCLIPACRRLRTDKDKKRQDAEEDEEDHESSDEDDEEVSSSETSLLRAARTAALKCLCALLVNAAGFDWTPYLPVITSEVVSPQLETLSSETTQGVSWTLRLLETWSLMPRCALALSHDQRIIPTIVSCISVAHTKDEVKIFALGIVRNLIRLALAPEAESEFNELILEEILQPNLDLVLGTIGSLVIKEKTKNIQSKESLTEKTEESNDDQAAREEAGEDAGDETTLVLAPLGRHLLEAAVETVVELAPLVENSKNVHNLVQISTFLLNQPARAVNPKVKGSILLILERFVVLENLQDDDKLRHDLYQTICSLFSFFKDRQNRQALSRLMLVFATQQPAIQEVATLSSQLNSFVENRLDEPDYDQRLAAFRAICNPRDVAFTVDQWLPLLHNFIHYIHHDEEHAILAQNAADGICKFIEATSAVWDEPSARKQYTGILDRNLLPAIYSGAREESEAVRREFLRVFGFLATNLSCWEPVKDLALLVPEAVEVDMNMEDERQTKKRDQDFFYNILTPAVSRQIQALQVLQGVNERAGLSSRNVGKFFIPLLEHFIFGREDGSDDQGLGAQATNTIASLAGSLEWSQYRALLRRYVSYIKSKPDLHKQVVRLLDKIVETLELAANQAYNTSMDIDSSDATSQKTLALAKKLPSQEKFTEEVSGSLLTTLLDHLHEKDETTVSSRVPVGIIVVKLLNLLPQSARDLKLPGVLTDICHILRSKAWDSREMARKTLVKIAVILGPSCFGFILKELRGALTRGYQLHVLSYTVHSLLLAVIPEFEQGDLDYCVSDIVSVIMDDTFGITGQEKEAEEYTSKMKEIKSSKSQDSMELIAKNASISRLINLVQPLKDLLMEKLNIKMVRKIDELLSRITAGLLQNPAAESRDTLVFCYEVIQEVINSEKPEAVKTLDPKLKRYLIQKGAKKNDRGTTTKHTYKLKKFAFDVLRSLMRKHDSLRTASNISGFIPHLGNAVRDDGEEVKIAAFKLLVVLVKVPFKNNDSKLLYDMALKDALRSINSSVSSTTELAQAALKLISVILRDRREVVVKDKDIDMIIGRIKDDLTEPLHRHVTFNFLRSVLDRKIETAAVYDTLDYVGTVMITNDDKDTRDLARGAYFQFLREYPQKKARWQKQLKFLRSNLDYDREGGRLSVMEVIHLLLIKTADDFVQEICTFFFHKLVLVLANDDSEKCTLAAGELVKEILRRSNKTATQAFLVHMRDWLGKESQPAVVGLGVQAFGYYFETRESSNKDNKDFELLTGKISGALADLSDDADLAQTSLKVLQKLVDKDPSRVLVPSLTELWERVKSCLSHSDPTVKLLAVRLLSSYLADFAKADGMHGSYGLELEKDDILELIQLNLKVLLSEGVSEPLAEEVSRILMFLGKTIKFEMATDEDSASESDDADEDTKASSETSIFGSLAAIVRREARPRSAELIPKLAAMDVMTVYCSQAPAATMQPHLRTILHPLRNLTDTSIPVPWSPDPDFGEKYETLKGKAHTVMEALQDKFGTASYTRALLDVGEEVKQKREERGKKRKIEAVTNRDKYHAEKRKKFEKKKERRKAKGQEHRALRQAV